MRLFALSLFACVLTLLGPARATVSVGRSAELLALAGERLELAVVAEYELQDPESYRVYQVELGAQAFVRKAPRVVRAADYERGIPYDELWRRYLAALPEPERRALGAHAMFRQSLRELALDVLVEGDASTSIGFAAPGAQASPAAPRDAQGRAELRLLWTTASMDAYDRADADAFDPCVDLYQKNANCSACRPSTLWVNGERTETWACKSGGSKLPPAYRARSTHATPASPTHRVPCACDARAKVYEFVLHSERRTARGSKVLVEPFRTFQAGGGIPYDVSLVLYGPGTGGNLRVYQTEDGSRLIAVGSALHAPNGNTTHFPIFAALSR